MAINQFISPKINVSITLIKTILPISFCYEFLYDQLNQFVFGFISSAAWVADVLVGAVVAVALVEVVAAHDVAGAVGVAFNVAAVVVVADGDVVADVVSDDVAVVHAELEIGGLVWKT